MVQYLMVLSSIQGQRNYRHAILSPSLRLSLSLPSVPLTTHIHRKVLPPTHNLSRIYEIRSIKKGSTCSFTEFFAKLLVVKDTTNFAHFSQSLLKSMREWYQKNENQCQFKPDGTKNVGIVGKLIKFCFFWCKNLLLLAAKHGHRIFLKRNAT